ncbi:MAG: HD domain-containing protein [Candidatus Paceibacterota bacterium]
MTISEIYKKYKINQGLQGHMYRVAAVAYFICKAYQEDIDTRSVVSACLLHDMGNLLKFKFDVAPELCEPEGVEYWQKVQTELKEKYGSNVHEATLAMVREISHEKKIVEVVNEASFDEIITVANEGSVEAQLLEYADMRVGLHGVVSLDSRFNDIKERYCPWRFSEAELETRRKAAKQIENELLASTILSPEAISDVTIREPMNELSNWEL